MKYLSNNNNTRYDSRILEKILTRFSTNFTERAYFYRNYERFILLKRKKKRHGDKLEQYKAGVIYFYPANYLSFIFILK